MANSKDLYRRLKYLNDEGSKDYDPKVGEVLRTVDREFLIPLFKHKKVSFPAFLVFNGTDLRSLGVIFPKDRIAVLEAIKNVHLYPWKSSCIPAITEPLTSLNTIWILVNLCKQLEVMTSTIEYATKHLSIRLAAPSEDDEFGKDVQFGASTPFLKVKLGLYLSAEMEKVRLQILCIECSLDDVANALKIEENATTKCPRESDYISTECEEVPHYSRQLLFCAAVSVAFLFYIFKK